MVWTTLPCSALHIAHVTVLLSGHLRAVGPLETGLCTHCVSALFFAKEVLDLLGQIPVNNGGWRISEESCMAMSLGNQAT